ncbi:MAG: site-2 protease family protein [Planctomycetes bacterium]|nr:site-2 protease family protein [Planctomycetota bacterium]
MILAAIDIVGSLKNVLSKPYIHIPVLAGIIYSIILHEASHAYMAHRVGDPTPNIFGLRTINPIPHIKYNIFWTLILPVATFILVFRGLWAFGGGSCPISPYFHKGRWDELKVAIAGPVANLAIFFVCALMLFIPVVTPINDDEPSANFIIFSRIGITNFILFVFNMLPCPPLDGYTVWASFFPGIKPQLDKIKNVLGFVAIIIAWRLAGYVVVPALLFTADSYRNAYAIVYGDEKADDRITGFANALEIGHLAQGDDVDG